MDNISEKLGVHDFFNVLVTGATAIIGLLYIFVPINTIKNLSLGIKEWIVTIVICFILGIIFQEICSFVDRYFLRFREKMISSFLKKDSTIIDNTNKKTLYRKYGIQLLKDKHIKYEEDFTDSQCNYIYGYCNYYIEVRGKHSKIEKMRALYDMSRTLFCLFTVLLITYIIKQLSAVPQTLSIRVFCFNLLIFLTIILLFYYRMRRTLIYKFKMTMAVYENIIDSEKRN